MEINVQVNSTELIKPSSPTPHHLHTFKLCLMDQFTPTCYIPLLFFYAATDGDGGGDIITEQSGQIKRSLSQVLTEFYPIAGRINTHLSTVECNDDGVIYLEAQVNCSLSEILQRPKLEELNRFVPKIYQNLGPESNPLLAIQFTRFQCGGTAVGLNINHKIADATALMSFAKAWSCTALGQIDMVVPDFTASTVFPPLLPFPISQPAFDFKPERFAINRFVFTADKISALKARATTSALPQPTRVEVVSSLLWKCSMAASRSRFGSIARPSSLNWPVNIRGRLRVPLPESCFGNVALPMIFRCDDETETNFPDRVLALRKHVREYQAQYTEKLGGDGGSLSPLVLEILGDLTNLLKKGGGESDCYTHSCIVALRIYDIDFGWGKPVYARLGDLAIPNVAFLTATGDGGGVEAWVSLVEEDMSLLEKDPELLEFASINPSVPVNL